MAEVNYNETVVLPLFQRKYQELMSSNLILEINLLVEQARNKTLQEQVNKLEARLAKKKKNTSADASEVLDGESY
jgi:hypothetical protein